MAVAACVIKRPMTKRAIFMGRSKVGSFFCAQEGNTGGSMSAQAEEVPFVSAMEREKACEVTIETGRKAFQFDGILDRLLLKARIILESRAADRGPDPDAPDDDEERILIPVRLLDRLGNSYQEAPKPSPESNIKAVLIGCTVTIVSAGVIGAIVLSNQFSALRAEFSEWKTATEHRLQQLERRP